MSRNRAPRAAGGRNPNIDRQTPRKIGEGPEEIVEDLDERDKEAARARVCELDGEIARLEEAFKTAKADWKARIEGVKNSRNTELEAVKTGKRSKMVMVQEWLEPNNEVTRMRTDGDRPRIIGKRNATADELQLGLFESDPSEPGPGAADDFPGDGTAH